MGNGAVFLIRMRSVNDNSEEWKVVLETKPKNLMKILVGDKINLITCELKS